MLDVQLWLSDNKYILTEAILLKNYGVSVDIGTSRVTLHLIDITTKSVVAESSIANPQTQFGLDIISRIRVSLEPTDEFSLSRTIRESVNSMLLDTLKRCEISKDHVSSIIIVVGHDQLSVL